MRACVTSLFLLLTAVAATAVPAELPTAALRDVAARIDYGWFTGDIALIRAARDALDASAREPWSRYLRAYASYRAAQLALARDMAADSDLEICASDADSAATNEDVTVEASVLIVACAAMAATVEPLRAVWHQRRLRQGLTQAEGLEAGNPRLLLVRQRELGETGIAADTIVAAFRDGSAGFPDWGEAEALLALCEQRLAAGDLRGARDSLEETLLIAPDYAAALELKSRIGALTAGR